MFFSRGMRSERFMNLQIFQSIKWRKRHEYKKQITDRSKIHSIQRAQLLWMGQQYANSPQGNGEIAMTEGELARFFGVTWRKLNSRLQAIVHNPNLHPDERSAGEMVMVRDNELAGYAPLYPLPIIIALSFLLDSTRSSFVQKIYHPWTTATHNNHNTDIPFGRYAALNYLYPFLSPILSYYITTKGIKRWKKKDYVVFGSLFICTTTIWLHTTYPWTERKRFL